jgi:hypothetical protein
VALDRSGTVHSRCELDLLIYSITGIHTDQRSSSGSPSASLSLRLSHDSLVGDTCLGATDIDIATLADLCGTGNESKGRQVFVIICITSYTYFPVVNLDLIGAQAKLNQRCVGSLAVRLMKPREGAAFAINKIQKSAASIGPDVSVAVFGAGGAPVEAGGGILEQAYPITSTITSALESVVSRLEIIVKIGDQIATVCRCTHEFSSLLTYSQDPPICQYCMESVDGSAEGRTAVDMTRSILIRTSGRETTTRC